VQLIEFRKGRKLSRAALGKLVGVDGVTVWRHETGRSMPKPSQVRKYQEITEGAVTADDHQEAVDKWAMAEPVAA